MPKPQLYTELCTKWNDLFPHFPLVNLYDPSLGSKIPKIINPKENSIAPVVRAVFQQFERRDNETSPNDAYGMLFQFYSTNESSLPREQELLRKPVQNASVNKKVNKFLDHLFDLMKSKTPNNP